VPRAAVDDPAGVAPSGDVDADLAARARSGDAAAFEALYERHVDAVHRFAFSRVRDAAAARDVTQDVFLAALRTLPGLRDPSCFRPWLMRIAHATLIDHWRRTYRGPRLVSLDAPGGAARVAAGAGLPAGRDDPARSVERRLEGEALLAALGRLTDLQQHVLTLRYIAELPVADTAEALGCSEDAVKKLQRRGLAALRRALAAEDDR